MAWLLCRALCQPLLRRGEIRIERHSLFESEDGALVLIEQRQVPYPRDWSAFSYTRAKFLRFATSSFAKRTVPSANPRVRRCASGDSLKALVSFEIEDQPLRHKLIGLRDPSGQVAVQ